MRTLRRCCVAVVALGLTAVGLPAAAWADDATPLPAEPDKAIDTRQGAAAEHPAPVLDEAAPVATSTTDVTLVPAGEDVQAESAPQTRHAPSSSADASDGLSLPVTTDGQHVSVAVTETSDDVSVLGVTWDETEADVQVFIRSAVGSQDSSDWEAVDTVPLTNEMTVAGTEPVVVTKATNFEVATVANQPIQPKLSVVDPGSAPADRMATARATTDSAPVIYTRADWGADESVVSRDPTYAQVKGVVIHHTAGSNSYTEAQVPGIIRGIFAYHTRDLGWSDIGYNVLVDKFGRAWEGRAGGLTRAVQGAHAYGANHLTFGISLLGDYETAVPTPVALDTIARVSGWKMSVHGVDLDATLRTSTGRSIPAVSGHRDSYATSCPGRHIYSQMASLRSSIVSYQSSYDSGVTVIAHTAGAKALGMVTNTWGRADFAPNAEVWTEVQVGSRWSRSQTRSTDAQGSFVIPLTYGANTEGVYTWRVGVRTTRGISYSNHFTLRRAPASTVTANAVTTKFTGQITNTWGTVPEAPNSTVWTEVKLASGWSRSQSRTTNDKGSFVVPLTYGSHHVDSHTWRVGIDTPLGVFYSNEFTLRRIAAPVTVHSASAGTKVVGQATNTWGTAVGAPNAEIWTEVQTSAGWSRSQSRTTDAKGAFVIPLTYGSNQLGTSRWRVAVRTTDGVFYSTEFTLTRVASEPS